MRSRMRTYAELFKSDFRLSRRALGLERDRGGLGHRERGGLGHLQPLRAVHAVGDPLVDLVEELVDEDVARNFLQHAAVRVDETHVAPTRDPEVGIPCLARAVDGAAEHRNLERLWVLA